MAISQETAKALYAALKAMCMNMEADGHAYRDCFKKARAALSLARMEQE